MTAFLRFFEDHRSAIHLALICVVGFAAAETVFLASRAVETWVDIYKGRMTPLADPLVIGLIVAAWSLVPLIGVLIIQRGLLSALLLVLALVLAVQAGWQIYQLWLGQPTLVLQEMQVPRRIETFVLCSFAVTAACFVLATLFAGIGLPEGQPASTRQQTVSVNLLVSAVIFAVIVKTWVLSGTASVADMLIFLPAMLLFLVRSPVLSFCVLLLFTYYGLGLAYSFFAGSTSAYDRAVDYKGLLVIPGLLLMFSTALIVVGWVMRWLVNMGAARLARSAAADGASESR